MRFTLFICLAFAQITNGLIGQTFLNVNAPAKGIPVAMTRGSGNDIYLLQYSAQIGYGNGKLMVSRWNELFWTSQSPLTVEEFSLPENKRLHMAWHQNRLYVAGSFRLGATPGGVIRLNGTHWEAAGGGVQSDYKIRNEVDMYAMVSFSGHLFVSGIFNLAGGKPVMNFAQFSNDTWAGIDIGGGYVRNIVTRGDTLFAGGNFAKIDQKPCKNLAFYTQDTWFAGPAIPGEIITLAPRQNGIMALSKDSVYFISDNLIKNRLKLPFSFRGDLQAATHGSTIYFAGDIVFMGRKVPCIQFDGLNWLVFLDDADIETGVFGVPIFLGTHGGLFLAGNQPQITGVPFNGVVKCIPGNSLLSGKLYQDDNSNCRRDPDEKPVHGIIISLDSGKYYVSSDGSGNFQMPFPTFGHHEIEIFAPDGHEIGCNLSKLEFASAMNDSNYKVEFPVQKSPGPAPENIILYSTSGFTARHGYTTSYKIRFQTGNAKEAITLFYPVELELVNSSHVIENSESGKLVFDAERGELIQFEFLVGHTRFKVGDILNFEAIVNGSKAKSVLVQKVVAAYDPNEKKCNKGEIKSNEKQLEYVVHFQNLGTDSAVNIFIVDTLSDQMPLQYIKVLANSHAPRFQQNYTVRDHALIWTFRDIMLPAKQISGDSASSGFVHFKAGLTDLKKGDVISNRGYIFFDFQDPVPTNLAVTKVTETVVSDPSEGGIIIYPNPASTEITIVYEPHFIRSATLYHVSGQKVGVKSVQPLSTRMTIPVSGLADGVYILRVDLTSGVVSRKINICSQF